MRFYSRIQSKPNAIIKEIRDGFKIVKQTRLCVFVNGVLDTEDEEVIRELKKHPDRFRTTKPYEVTNWRMTEKGIELLKVGESYGIDCRHIRPSYLKKLIAKKIADKVKPIVKEVLPEPEKVEALKELPKEEEAPVVKKKENVIDYKAIMAKVREGKKKKTKVKEKKK